MKLVVSSLPRRHEVSWVLAPAERVGIVGLVMVDVVFDGGDALVARIEDRMLALLPPELGEKALDGVHPRGRCRGEMEGPVGTVLEPPVDLGRLVGGNVVENDMDRCSGLDLRGDMVEEGEELLGAVTLDPLAGDLPGGDVEGRHQAGCAVALEHAKHRRDGDPQLLGQRPQRPVTGVLRRRRHRKIDQFPDLVLRQRLAAPAPPHIVKQAVDTLLEEAIPPPPHGRLRQVGGRIVCGSVRASPGCRTMAALWTCLRTECGSVLIFSRRSRSCARRTIDGLRLFAIPLPLPVETRAAIAWNSQIIRRR